MNAVRFFEIFQFRYYFLWKSIKDTANLSTHHELRSEYARCRSEAWTKQPTFKTLFRRNQSSQEWIEIVDHGAGSRRHSSTKRRVSDLLKHASNTGPYADLLWLIAKQRKAKRTLELGTNLGFGCLALASGFLEGTVTSVEGCPNTFTQAQKNIQTSGLYNTRLINQRFDDFLDQCVDQFDLVYIDGHHEGKALLKYFGQLKAHLSTDAWLILDDIRWSKDMRLASKQIASAPEVLHFHDFGRMALIILAL